MKRSSFILVSGIWILISQISSAIVDSNNNGLSDLWEKHYNSGNLLTDPDPLADPDGDGWSNAQEAAAGTDPFDPNPPGGFLQPDFLHVPETWSDWDYDDILEHTPEAVVLTWETIPGKKYTLLTSPDLTEESWMPVGEPMIGNGNLIENGFPVTETEAPRPDKLFWRVAVTESGLDSDSDGLSNYEEHLAGTNPVVSDSDGDTLSDHAEILAGTNPFDPDEDSDGLTDPFELAAGTDSKNQDSDGDGIPDLVDPQPLVSAFSFPDADSDGIADADDTQPNTPRGPAPSIDSETASGNPVSNIAGNEAMSFVITVSNPAGPAPSASDFTFFINGVVEPDGITAIGGSGGSQRFLITWTAETAVGYPVRILQNLTLRFQDAQKATTWLNLARIDVAEWEGMVAGLPDQRLQPFTEDSWVVQIASHLNGKKTFPFELAGNYRTSGGNRYRGPLAIRLLGEDGLTVKGLATISTGVRYPMMFIARESISLPVTASQVVDISSPEVIPARCIGYRNSSDYEVTMTLPNGNVSLEPNEMKFNFLPDQEENPLMYRELGSAVGISGYFSDRYVDAPYFSPSSRIFDMGILENSDDNDWPVLGSNRMFIQLESSITPHAAGSLEIPGLALPRSFLEDTSPLPLATEQWHKIVLKVGPDAGAVSNGVQLKLGTGEEGEGTPQTGFELQAQDENGLSALTIPTDGKIEITPTSELYQKLISPGGLTLFLKRNSTVTEFHQLGLDLMPKSSTYTVQRVAELNLPLVDLIDIKNHINTTDDVNIAPWDTAQDINETNIAWIEPHKSETDDAPQMPALVFSVLGLPQNILIEAKLLVNYRRPYTGSQNDDTVRIPIHGSFQPISDGRWEIWSDYSNLTFFGGDATLTYKINGGVEQILNFAIGGRNPTELRCKAYTQGRPGAPWYAYAIEKHESQGYNPGFYNQFWERSGDSSPVNAGVNYTFTRGDPLVVRSRRESGVGGAGLAQVTGAGGVKTVPGPREVFWNWQKNVDAFLVILSGKITEAELAMNNPAPRKPPALRPDGQRPQSQFDTGALVPIPLVYDGENKGTQGTVRFSDNAGDNRPENAVAIKRYNGAEADWCSWAGTSQTDTANHHWQWNYGDNNYVEEVCNQIEEAQP